MYVGWRLNQAVTLRGAKGLIEILHCVQHALCFSVILRNDSDEESDCRLQETLRFHPG